VTSYGGEFGEILCGFCQQIALSPFSIEKNQQKQKKLQIPLTQGGVRKK
jgi:hypothetical protein